MAKQFGDTSEKIKQERTKALRLYLSGMSIQEIADALGRKIDTIYKWKLGRTPKNIKKVALERTYSRYMLILSKDKKNPTDLKELEVLGRIIAPSA